MSGIWDSLSEFGGDIVDGVSDFAGSAADLVSEVWGNVSESVSDVYSDGNFPDFISGLVNPSSDGGASYSANYAARQGIGYVAPTEEKKSWGDMFNSFVSDKENQKMLVERGFGFVAGMAEVSAAKDAAKYRAEADSAFLTQQDKLKQDADKRFSESVGGLNPVKPWKPKPLTRMDGSRVFKPTGLINSGVK